MDWAFKLSGKDVTFQILDDQVAVLPVSDLTVSGLQDLQTSLGEPVGHQIAAFDERPFAARHLFGRSGWGFVHPRPEVAKAVETRSDVVAGASVNRVVVSNTNAVLITTDLATVRLHSDVSDQQATAILQEDNLGIVYRLKCAPNTFEVQLPAGRPLPQIIHELQQKTDRYVYAEPSLLQVINGRSTPSDPGFALQWQHSNDGLHGGVVGMDLHSTAAWAITRGRGPDRPVRVAVIDNGMQVTHPDLQPAIISGGFFEPEGGGKARFLRLGMANFPDTGHGTFCLGLVGAQMNDRDGCGIAPEANLIAIACLQDQVGTQTTLARAICYAADPSTEDDQAVPTQGADIISCSLSTQGLLTSVLRDSITCAANQGREGLGVPIFWAVSNKPIPIVEDDLCSHEDVIAIGKYNRRGLNDIFASGPKLEYVAPGTEVFSTGSYSNFREDSGTSFATPLAAGVAALVMSLQPNWTRDRIRDHLRQSCDRIDLAVNHSDTSGFGRLNAETAVVTAKNAV